MAIVKDVAGSATSGIYLGVMVVLAVATYRFVGGVFPQLGAGATGNGTGDVYGNGGG